MYAVEAPDVEEARGGLLQVADVIDNAARQAFFEGVTYQDHLWGQTRKVPTDGTEKIFDQSSIVESQLFSVYRGVDYSMFQMDMAEASAKEAFGGGETYAVERAVQELILNPRAVDITPTAGTPMTKPKYAAGLLEQYAAENYRGLPLLHADRATTTLIVDPEFNDDWTLHTMQGTPLANGGGYSRIGPGGTAAPAGAGWVWISGQVHVWRGETNVYMASDLPGNRHISIAEATYAVTVDSFVAAILVGI